MFANALKQFQGREVFLYGAGGFGVEMLCRLRSAGIQPRAFLDQNAEQIQQREGVPVYTAESAPLEFRSGTVLFCIVMDREQRREVLSWLKGLGYRFIVEGQSLRVLLVQPDDGIEEPVYFKNRREKIQSARELFREDFSRTLYDKIVYSHWTRDYTGCAELESPMWEQYFPPDIPLSKGYMRFVDCGGYTGDTVTCLTDRKGAVEACAVFEPDSRNYIKMVENTASLKEKIGQRLCFPCAVSQTAEQLRFAAGTGSGSLSAAGESVVQTVSLDQAIPDFHPTMLKMDIEGAELLALQGAQELIRADRPDLAVCVYHTINHIWDIPLLLDSWKLGYRFYLRSYNAYTMETVLYASV